MEGLYVPAGHGAHGVWEEEVVNEMLRDVISEGSLKAQEEQKEQKVRSRR
jgi:hypothetical protein